MNHNNDDEIIIDDEFIEQFAGIRTTAVQPEFLEEIGRAVANFALLEYELFLLIHGLLGTEVEISRIITSELFFRNLLDLSTSLIKQIHGDSIVQKYKDILKTITEAEKKRNLIVHSIWAVPLNMLFALKLQPSGQKVWLFNMKNTPKTI